MPVVDVIAIDGPTASGKGTVAGRLAKELGFHYLDSGALFRLTALSVLRADVDLTDAAACAQIALAMRPFFQEGRIFLGDEDVTEAIRAESVGIAASKVAVIPAVREALLQLEKAACVAPGLVADGRDMASVVFPEARLKVFLTASAQARAERRFKQLKEKNISANMDNLVRDLEERDRRDRERAAAPCVPAADARVLDSSEMSVEETVNVILQWWKEIAR